MIKIHIKLLLAVFVLALCYGQSYSQTTDFTYQGFLKFDGAPANGSFEFEFSFCDAPTDGSCFAPVPNIIPVQVIDGVFTVTLNIGAFVFTGPDRFLQIRARPAGTGSITTLSPRVKVTSSPFALMARDTARLNGLPANQYVLTGDARLSDARNPLPNSPNYIQNSTSQQASSDFNISGTGTANVLNATRYNISGSPMVRASGTNTFVGAQAGPNATGGSNTFFGQAAGQATTTGSGNSFFGRQAGNATNTGHNNSFFGAQSGFFNTTGFQNSFFGSQSGVQNTTGANNSFFGMSAGEQNTTGSFNAFFGESSGFSTTGGSGNSFFGRRTGHANTGGLDNSFFGKIAGEANTTGSSNVFMGASAGRGNTTGNNNAFFGTNAGQSNTTGTDNAVLGTNAGLALASGSNNTLVGQGANVASGNLTFATAIGSQAVVSTSNTVQLGRAADTVFVPGNLVIGAPTTATEKFHLAINGGQILIGDAGCNPSFTGIGFGVTLSNCNDYSLLGNGTDTIIGRPTGGTLSFREGNLEQMRISPGGTVRINTLGTAGGTSLCRNANSEISSCSSSLRYKTNVVTFRPGLDLIRLLRPVSFNWRDGGMLDLGLVAEEVNNVEPLLSVMNDKGEVEGVKYDRVGVVLVNAVNEQQAEIESQRNEIKGLRDQVTALKALMCASQSAATVCKE